MRSRPQIPEEIEEFRDAHWRREGMRQVETILDAEHFIEQVGFAACLTDARRPGPSLYVAVCGRRDAVMPRHVQKDPEASLTWQLKDELVRRGRVYYAKLARGRAMFLAPRMIPYFHAVLGVRRSGERERLSTDARAVVRAGQRIEKGAENIQESYESHVMAYRRLVGNITWVGLHDTERDRFKGLDLRSTLGTGLAWLAHNGDQWKLTVAGGAAWEHEDFVPASGKANDSYPTLNLYVKNTFSLSASSTLTQTASSNLGNDGQRIDGDVKLETAVTEWLHVVLSYDIEHDNDPLLDIFDQTDRTFTASLNLNLGGG